MLGLVKAPFSIPREYQRDLREIFFKPTEFGKNILEGTSSLPASDFLGVAIAITIAVWQVTYFAYRTYFQPNYGFYIVICLYVLAHVLLCLIVVWVLKARKSSPVNTARVFSYALGGALPVIAIPIEIFNFIDMSPGLAWNLPLCQEPRVPECILANYSLLNPVYVTLGENIFTLFIELWVVWCLFKMLRITQGVSLWKFAIVAVFTTAVGMVDYYPFFWVWDWLHANHFT